MLLSALRRLSPSRGKVSAVAAVLAAVAAALAAVSAPAAERDDDLFVRPEDQRSLLFASVDAGRSVFASAGSKQTLTGPLDRPGFLITESGGFGMTRERYRSEGTDLPATRLTTQSSLLFGHQWNEPGLFLAALAGPELQHEQLTVANRVYRFSKPRYGLQGQVELWATPSSDTMLTGTVVTRTSRLSVWARGSAGLRVGGGLYAGPEVMTYATDTYRELRVGLHLTGVQVGIVQGRISAGWMMTDDGKPGTTYVGASAWIRM
ncbi:MAG: hypothetical protein JWR08_2433 [Enterovirga sp.]|nr:hypothetical protein [Enterovirga sp.]